MIAEQSEPAQSVTAPDASKPQTPRCVAIGNRLTLKLQSYLTALFSYSFSLHTKIFNPIFPLKQSSFTRLVTGISLGE